MIAAIAGSLAEHTWEAGGRSADWIADMFACDVDREAVTFGRTARPERTR